MLTYDLTNKKNKKNLFYCKTKQKKTINKKFTSNNKKVKKILK